MGIFNRENLLDSVRLVSYSKILGSLFLGALVVSEQAQGAVKKRTSSKPAAVKPVQQKADVYVDDPNEEISVRLEKIAARNPNPLVPAQERYLMILYNAFENATPGGRTTPDTVPQYLAQSRTYVKNVEHLSLDDHKKLESLYIRVREYFKGSACNGNVSILRKKIRELKAENDAKKARVAQQNKEPKVENRETTDSSRPIASSGKKKRETTLPALEEKFLKGVLADVHDEDFDHYMEPGFVPNWLAYYADLLKKQVSQNPKKVKQIDEIYQRYTQMFKVDCQRNLDVFKEKLQQNFDQHRIQQISVSYYTKPIIMNYNGLTRV